ncbi:helix-turn-helix transcriptional regulator [Morganella morganii]|uniref:helix-turn-helix domain-containing protein n=1 Tax=Morganella morganii TaxID=582 RepID=UPI000D1E2A8D|nr:AraC family transcriptional regulator [Morganella morganii]HAE79792.1 AraC family transcriptional regulator [Morganella sp. (in: enterobacteria)]QXO43151.1 helix-turn-helix transcriptional regulator [Morganella morganii]QXO46733.1 helix-turn-helix transcriptional regulator [Morganella morganii]QXO50493.1 helix-turn-helix transcriptional regulator [Morganella morganii]QXO54344.1 helix-turn-helix transcriptional regulator [Morganella morganii]
MTTHDSELTELVPVLTEETDTLLTGESTLADHGGVPLTFGSAYLALLICRAGYANMTLNFKSHAVRAGDILVLAEDTIALLKKRSRGFRVFYCLIPATFSAEIAYVLPNPLFLFLHEYPRCIPLPAEKPLLSMWLAQMHDITRNSPVYRHIMQRNHLQNLFLRIAERMPPDALAATQKYSRKETLCWQFWELICRHSREHRDVQFYARQLNITPFYLSQLTKTFFNHSPKSLINRRVVPEIKTLLRYSTLSAEQIADKLHFNDPSYLCRYFRRETGVSLTAYRRQHT